MEIINKYIVNNSAKSFNAEQMPSIKDNVLIGPQGSYSGTAMGELIIDTDSYNDEYNDWRRFPMNIIIDEKYDTILPKVQYERFMKINGSWDEESDGNKFVIRYSDIIRYYNDLLNFINNCEYWMMCSDRFTYIGTRQTSVSDLRWEEYFSNHNISGDSSNSINRFFASYEDESGNTVQNEIMSEIPIGGDDDDDYALIGKMLCINASADDFLAIYGDDWISTAKGVIKLYEDIRDNKRKDNIRIALPYFNLPVYIEQEYNDEGMFTTMLDEWIPNKEYYSEDKVIYDEQVYVLDLSETTAATYSGYYVESARTTLFDELDEEGNYKHWKLAEIESSVTVSAYTASQLSTLKREVASNTYPFILEYENDTGETPTSSSTLPYAISLHYDSEMKYVEGVTKVEFYHFDENNEEIIDKTIEDGTGLTNNGKISFEEMPEESTAIRFTYVKYRNVNDNDSGIVYKESYEVSSGVTNVQYDDDTGKTVYYINVNYDEPIDRTIVEFDDTYTSYEAKIIKEEPLLGINKINSDVSGYVDRGTANAYERHNILAEINTFEDLENYRNNYFNL